MITIEFEEPGVSTCKCCGQDIYTLARFVHQYGEPFAVYYAKFTKGHDDKVVHGLVSLGQWGKGSEASARLAFPFIIWITDTDYEVKIVNAKESPWKNVTSLGRIVNRKEGLNHPWIKNVFHITDHIVTDDKLVVDYFFPGSE
jgi:hypothetical protein